MGRTTEWNIFVALPTMKKATINYIRSAENINIKKNPIKDAYFCPAEGMNKARSPPSNPIKS